MTEPITDIKEMKKTVEAVLFAAGHPVTYEKISRLFDITPKKTKDFIVEYAKEYNLPITLSISLHAPDDEIRSSMMKVNRKWNIDALLKACKEYQKVTTRRISFEYALIEGVNDSEKCADLLARRLKGTMCHVNLIPANPVKENTFKKPDKNRIICYLNSTGVDRLY